MAPALSLRDHTRMFEGFSKYVYLKVKLKVSCNVNNNPSLWVYTTVESVVGLS